MKFDENKWKAALTKAASDLKGCGPTEGIVCALASIRLIRDSVVENVDADSADVIKTELNDLIQQLPKIKLQGFCCNASAAAKFAKLEAGGKAGIELSE